MDAAAPERMRVSPRPRSFDPATLIFAALPAPLAGAFLACVLAYNEEWTLARIAMLVVAPGTALAFSRRRGMGWWAGGGLALLAFAVAWLLIGFVILYMWWEIGRDWGHDH